MRRVFHGHGLRSSVIVDQIDIEGVAVLEAENNAPVTGHGHAPKTSQIASKPMQAITWQIEIFRIPRLVEQTKDILYPFQEVWGHLAPLAALIKTLETAVPEALDHGRV